MDAPTDRASGPVGDAIETLSRWPWLDTLATLRQRFRDDRLGQTAGSLTFTTLIALVPLVAVMLAVFSAFPMFRSLQGSLEQYFLQALVPENIARPVLRGLTQFAAKANQLGTLGLVLLVATALALMLTIDRTLNAIWRVRKPRPIAQRVLVYWAALTLGPLVLALSLTAWSYALSASRGIVGALPGGVSFLIDVAEFVLLGAATAGLYHYVPNTFVRWRHALAGGAFVALAFEGAKRALGWYVATVPTYSVVFGAFASVPILLLWVYLVWVIVLLGAVIAAYAPSLSMRIVRRPPTPGQGFEMALSLLTRLRAARATPARGVSAAALAEALRADPLQVEPLLERLIELDWVARIDEDGAQRFVLLCEPETTRGEPLLNALLLPASETAAAFRRRAGFDRLMLADLL